jgi:hypothetical protein
MFYFGCSRRRQTAHRSMSPASLGGAHLNPLLRLAHDVLIDPLARLELRDLSHFAATCRLLQYGQNSPQTPNPVEDALRLRIGLSGWSRTLPVNLRGAIKYLLRLAWQDDLEFCSISTDRFRPISYFVDSDALRACGVELHRNANTEAFLKTFCAAPAGSLGFGHDWWVEFGSAYLRKEEPTLVPTAEGVRMRSMAFGGTHGLALTDEGQVYTWGSVSQKCRTSQTPALFKAASSLKVRRVATCAYHSAALTDEGKLHTWCDHKAVLRFRNGGAAGAGYQTPELSDLEGALCRPRCVEGALAVMRIASVAAANTYTIVATDQGAARPNGTPRRLHLGSRSFSLKATMPAIQLARRQGVAQPSPGSCA